MRNPLRYQATMYDCGPTSFVNALLYLFEREEMRPELLQQVYAVTLDKYHGPNGPGGTSANAMRYLAEWLCEYGASTNFPVEARHLRDDEVALTNYCQVARWIAEGGCAVASCYLSVDHYVLYTGVNLNEEGLISSVRLFDPWLEDLDTAWLACGHFFGCTPNDVRVVRDHPFEYNRVVSIGLVSQSGLGTYSLACKSQREITLIRRTDRA